MPTEIIIGLVVSAVLTGVGGVCGTLCRASRNLHHAEIKGMQENGLLEGEPQYMKSFRVGRAEYDLENNLLLTRYANIAFWVGIAGMAIMAYVSVIVRVR